jgi:hypothetical protein
MYYEGLCESRNFGIEKLQNIRNSERNVDEFFISKGLVVRFPVGVRNLCPLQIVWTFARAHTASYAMGTKGYFPGDKAAGQ